MLAKFPYMNEYWADKRAKMDHIDVPAYVRGQVGACGRHVLICSPVCVRSLQVIPRAYILSDLSVHLNRSHMTRNGKYNGPRGEFDTGVLTGAQAASPSYAGVA